MSEYTGVNPRQVLNTISDFREECDNLAQKIFKVDTEFLNNLSTKWAADNAPKYGEVIMQHLQTSLDYFCTGYMSIVNSAVENLNNWLKFNNQTTYDSQGIRFGDYSSDGKHISYEKYDINENYVTEVNYPGRRILKSDFKETFPDNGFGMVIPDVRKLTEGLYTTYKYDILSAIDSLPIENIAFYDEKGEQVLFYKESISEMSGKVQEYMQNAIEQIDALIKEEVKRTENASQQYK